MNFSASNHVRLTVEGLPLTKAHSLNSTTETKYGPPRRVRDIRPVKPIAASELLSAKHRLDSVSSGRIPLIPGPANGSLINVNDDEELIDYFVTGTKSCNGNSNSKTNATNSDFSNSLWDVQQHNVPTLPSLFPLEKSAVLQSWPTASLLCLKPAILLHRSTPTMTRLIA